MSGGILLATASTRSRDELKYVGQGLVSENYFRGFVNAGQAPGTQVIYASSLGLRAGDVVTNLHCILATAGTSTAPTLIKMALCSKAGVVLAQSANLASDAMWTSGLVPKTVPMAAAYTATDSDLYYGCVLVNGAFAGTNLQLGRLSPSTTGYQNAIGSGAAAWTGQTGQTDFAATGGSQTFTASAGAGTNFWIGVS